MVASSLGDSGRIPPEGQEERLDFLVIACTPAGRPRGAKGD
ncbi:hypothetical protein [Streptomyces sp. NPDC006274]